VAGVTADAPAPAGPGGNEQFLAWSSPGELIATASHELRQPLASVRGFTEMLLGHWDEFSDAEKQEMLKAVLHDAVRLARLVDELLDVGRLESGRLQLNPRETALADLVRSVVNDLKASHPTLDAALDVPEGFPPLLVDPFKLEQVLANVVENCCKHGAPATVRISVARVAGVEDMAEVSVSDRGPGIPPEELPHVTEKFFRRNDRRANGLGLGLWISKGIIEAHGGSLVASSPPGEGATVRFTVPLSHPASGRGGGKSVVRGGAGTGKLAGP
jgi:signal transduction histidine kinase